MWASRVAEHVAFGAAAWAVAGAVGYVAYLRPAWYPTHQRKMADEFTPTEVSEWNRRQSKR